MRCTPDEIRQHESSNIWLDLVEELDIWLTEIRDNLESDDLPLEQMPKLQGSAKALRNVIGMLPILADNAETQEENE